MECPSLQVVYNVDSCRIGPKEWVQLAKILHKHRNDYDAFLVVHGTDTMAYTASALSMMLLGFRKPIVMTGKGHPLVDRRQLPKPCGMRAAAALRTRADASLPS